MNIETKTEFPEFVAYENGFDKSTDTNFADMRVLTGEALGKMERYFKEKGKQPASYAYTSAQEKFFENNKNYELVSNDTWLYLADVGALLKRFKSFDSGDISYDVINRSNFKRFADMINRGFKPSVENPYSDWQSEPWVEYVKNLIDKDETILDVHKMLVLTYKGEDVGSVMISFDKTGVTPYAYICAYTYPPEFRKTQAFRSSYCILKYINSLGCNQIYSRSELDGYPYKLYTKIGFKPLFVTKLFVNNQYHEPI
ncbi:MAG: hypothetical protein FWC00_04505 [Firmicutes bacterium]|nr:hypothetical protein [Bacillota bacterium]